MIEGDLVNLRIFRHPLTCERSKKGGYRALAWYNYPYFSCGCGNL